MFFPVSSRGRPKPSHGGSARLFKGRVAARCGQMAVMMYDTAIPLEKFYTRLMTDWTKQLANAVSRRNGDLILGIPAYEDAGGGYHHPSAENISSARRGISAAGRNKSISGIALYCEWEMSEAKWRERRHFVK